MKEILIVDDDKKLREQLTRILRKSGYLTEEASSGKEAVGKAKSRHFDIVLLDLMMPGISGIDTMMEIKKTNRKTKIIMLTAFATVGSAVEAIKKGANEFIAKPFRIDELLVIIKRVIEEAGFEETLPESDLNNIFSTLSNPIRRQILKLLYMRSSMRFSEIIKSLNIEDHTKIVFHLRSLKEAGVIDHDDDKAYVLTGEGEKVLDALINIEHPR